VLTKQGVRALVAQRGTKFVKMFRGFLSAKLLPALNAEAAKQEQGVTIEGGLNDQSGEVQSISPTIQDIG